MLTHAQATRIAFDGRRAVGLQLRHQGRDAYAAARGEVVLASGAIGSPQLLQLSGVGPGELLAELGIPVVHEQPEVGANLQDHLQLRLIYRVEGTPTLNEQAARLLARAWMGLEYLLFRRGPLTMAPSQLGAFARSDAARATPNLEYHIQPLWLDKFGEPLHPFPGVHRLGLQPAPREPRQGPDQEPRAAARRPRSGRTTSRPRAIARSRRTRSG